MTATGIFLLDANVFIESAKRYYAFDVVPSFWTTLVDHAQEGRVQSLDRVKDEIDRQKDELQRWSDENFKEFYQPSARQDVVTNLKDIVVWGHSSTHYRPAAKRQLAEAKRADGWLVAYAMAEPGVVVVTTELDDPSQRKKVPIPAICTAFGVPWIDPFNMLRQLGVAF